MLLKTNTIIGHRGCRDVTQNNTIEAFMKARKEGAEMVEMDIRRTRDGVLLVWHDQAIGTKRIRGATFEELLAEANANGQVLPTLEDVLKALEGELQICLELKEAGYEEEVVSLTLKYFAPCEFVITSYLDQALLMVKKRFPTVEVGLIVGVRGRNEEFAWKGWRRITQKISEVFPWRRMKICEADFLVINWRLLCLRLAQRARRRDIYTLIGVINTPRMASQVWKSRYYQGIISDYPGMIAEVIKNL